MVTREVTENKADTTASKAPMNAAEAIAAAQKAQKNSLAGATEAQTNERGFVRVFEKASLIGKPFTIIDWDKTPAEFGMMYDINAICKGKAVWIRDGGTGISAQLEKLAENGVRTMIDCPRGLRVSKYKNQYNGEDSETYYLDENDL